MCVFSIFIIFEKENYGKRSSFKISTNYILNNKLNENCQYIHETPFAFCGESKLYDCRNCLRESCSLIQCGKEEEDSVNHFDNFETFYEICVPLSITDKKKKSLCKNFYGANTYRQYNECKFDINHNLQSSKSEIYIIIIFLILICSFFVIYYNVYLIKKRQMPFSPPGILPELLFPKPSEESKRMKSDDEKAFKHINQNSLNNY